MKYNLEKDKIQYVVAGSHLDTQWRWTIQQTVDEFLPRTILDNFALIEKYPDYVFNFEGAYRYMLIKKHYPAEYEKIKHYVKKGNWVPNGSMVDMPDVNIPCPESLVRQILYGNLFFEQEFGMRSGDIYLPDCFGFGAALPTVAVHCGLKGFSTQKLLSWRGGTYRDENNEVHVGIPFEIGVWEGIDGSPLVAALNAGHYMGKWQPREKDIETQGKRSGLWLNYHYFGVGDRGGAKPEENVRELMERIARNDCNGNIKVVNTASDQMYKDLTPEQIAKLPRYRGELLCTQASGGFYTAEARMKLWNRRCELMADAAERSRVIADWAGVMSYPREALREAWIEFLWHQMHDDLAGVSTKEAHDVSENDYRRSHIIFSAVAHAGIKALAGLMDTSGKGRTVLVYNPLSAGQESVVSLPVWFKDGVKQHAQVFDKDGNEVPSEILENTINAAHNSSNITISFLASAPSAGAALFDIRPSEADCRLDTGLHADEKGMENKWYKVAIDGNGDVRSIFDKNACKELLCGPIRLQQLFDFPPGAPAWDIAWDDIKSEPREYVTGPATVTVESTGPVCARVRIERTLGASIFVQVLKLAAGDAGAMLEVDMTIQWNTLERLLKLEFPLGVSNPRATYDLGLGAIQRGNNSAQMHEVIAQQWADITDTDGGYGVTIVSDCKYGWDKPSDKTLRLTIMHTPKIGNERYFYDMPDQAFLDTGKTHHIRYAVFGHKGDWRTGRSVVQGQRLNQPLIPVAVPSHEGPLGRSFEFLKTCSDRISVMALKKAERSDDIIVRVRETAGEAMRKARVFFASDIAAASEVDGQELSRADVAFAKNYIEFDIMGFQPRAFAVRLAKADGIMRKHFAAGGRIEEEPPAMPPKMQP